MANHSINTDVNVISLISNKSSSSSSSDSETVSKKKNE